MLREFLAAGIDPPRDGTSRGNLLAAGEAKRESHGGGLLIIHNLCGCGISIYIYTFSMEKLANASFKSSSLNNHFFLR